MFSPRRSAIRARVAPAPRRAGVARPRPRPLDHAVRLGVLQQVFGIRLDRVPLAEVVIFEAMELRGYLVTPRQPTIIEINRTEVRYMHWIDNYCILTVALKLSRRLPPDSTFNYISLDPRGTDHES
jgi:hypothetical protein